MTRIRDQQGSVVQQSLTLDPSDYRGYNMSKSFLGVVLSLTPADSDQNRSAFQTSDRRGHFHTCSVLVINSLRGQYMKLDNVVIPPDSRSGVDDYFEHLPRPCTTQVNGSTWDSTMSNVDPFTLDGDWCVVSFLDGSIDSPYISRWWQSPANLFDPGTSGRRNPNDQRSQKYLDQVGRYLKRTNGIELVITKDGNVYFSTTRASTEPQFGPEASPDEGRFPRTTDSDTGGSVKAWIKPSQSFEIDFNPQKSRLGALDVPEDQLPQPNPKQRVQAEAKQDTYVLLEKDQISLSTSDKIALNSKKRILISSDEETTITVGTDLSTEVSGNLTTTTSGDLSLDTTGSTTIAGQGTITVRSQDTVAVSGSSVTLSGVPGGASGTPWSLEVSPTGVTLGTGSLGGVVGGTNLIQAFLVFASSLNAASSGAMDAGYATAVATAASALAASLNSAVSRTTTTG